MTRIKKAIIQLPLIKWLVIEMAALVIFSLLWSLESRLAGYSAFVGGLIFVIPNVYFAHRMYRYQGARHAHLMVGSMFRAEGRKAGPYRSGFCGSFHLDGASPCTGSVIHFCCNGCSQWCSALPDST